MSEKSFAVASVSVAFVWGTFFYPPAASDVARLDAGPAASQVIERGAAPSSLALRPVALGNAGNARMAPDIHRAILEECPLGAPASAACAPLHKIAGH